MRLLPRGGPGALLPLVVMLLLAMLTFWLDRTIDLSGPESAGPVTHDPDYVIEKFTLLRLSESGDPRYTLTAARMLHFPDDDTSLLTTPVLVQMQPGKSDLRIHAERGIVFPGGEKLDLHDKVEIFRAGRPGGESGDLHMRTSYLRVLPDDDRAETPARVIIDNGASTISGTGMDFDNRYRQFKLRAAVTTTYHKPADAGRKP